MECKDRPPRSFLPGAQTCMAVLLLLLVYSISRQAAVLTSAASARAAAASARYTSADSAAPEGEA